ncbi:hypothetical protein [Paracoccus cavernae]|uniref:hypothetical protein n=1 Tax=Paracoccus cavernae TaxID=1571207 RepID=UPI00363761CA
MVGVSPVNAVRDASGDFGWRVEPIELWQGVKAARENDVFEDLARRARRAGMPAPFQPWQVDAARRYRALVEMHAAGAVKCVGLEAQGGSGGGGSFIDAFWMLAARSSGFESGSVAVLLWWCGAFDRLSGRMRTFARHFGRRALSPIGGW